MTAATVGKKVLDDLAGSRALLFPGVVLTTASGSLLSV